MIGAAISLVGGFLKGIPWQAFAGLAAGLVIWQGIAWHGRELRKADAAGYARAMGEVRIEQDKLAARLHAVAAKAEKLSAAITEEVSTRHVETVTSIHARAAALRLRHAESHSAPSRGADLPSVPVSAGRVNEAAGNDGLPFAVAVDALEQCSLNTAQLVDIQDWLRRQKAASETPPQ